MGLTMPGQSEAKNLMVQLMLGLTMPRTINVRPI
jgi:hypothetical protein